MKKADMIIISELRKDSRKNINQLAKKLKIPPSTLYDRLNHIKKHYVSKNASLLNFRKLGFFMTSFVTIGVTEHTRTDVLECLMQSKNINSMYKLNFGSKYLVETVFHDIDDFEQFMAEIKHKKADILMISHVSDCIIRENFLTEMHHFDCNEEGEADGNTK